MDTEPKKILLLEDDAAQNDMLKEVLEASFYSVTAVNNGVKGLKEIMASDYDIILCDMMMPSLPGDMFYLAVQRTKPHLCRRFIFVTGNYHEPNVKDFIERIHGTVAEKPLNIEQLIHKMDGIIEAEVANGEAKAASAYQGERIDIDDTLREIDVAAVHSGWVRQNLSVTDAFELPSYRRLTVKARTRIYISAGIHGDEPAGPASVLKLMQDKDWPPLVDLWICPCLNPNGFRMQRAENAQGIDLDMDYRHRASKEVQAHIKWLGSLPKLDLTICLREDWGSPGFYVCEINMAEQPSLARKAVMGAAAQCLINRNPVINKQPAENGVIDWPPNPQQRMRWSEPYYLAAEKTNLALALQAPSSLALSTRVAALVGAVRSMFDVLKS